MGAASALSSHCGFVGLRRRLSRRGSRVRPRRVDEFVSRSELAPRHSRGSFPGARGQRGGNAACAKVAVGKQPQRFVPTAAENRSRVDAVSLRGYGARVPGRVQQFALLNTNTRYLHDNVLRYAERLTELCPAPLRVCYFVNSGSEANELALRLARAHTGREDIVVLEHAYHGHTNTLIDISPYKFNGPGGRGRKPWVHVAPIADDYRGAYRRGEQEIGKKYAAPVGES